MTAIPATATPTSPAPAGPALPHLQQLLARQRAAGHSAAVAIARWRSGVTPPDLSEHGGTLSAQLRWHRQLQEAHQAWLEAGGFARQRK
jgi:hypothetical protein